MPPPINPDSSSPNFPTHFYPWGCLSYELAGFPGDSDCRHAGAIFFTPKKIAYSEDGTYNLCITLHNQSLY